MSFGAAVPPVPPPTYPSPNAPNTRPRRIPTDLEVRPSASDESTRGRERHRLKKHRRRQKLKTLESKLVLRLRRLRTGRRESIHPGQHLSARKELKAATLQSRQAVRGLARDAARTGGVYSGPYLSSHTQSGTTRRAVYDIGRHPIRASEGWWRRFWHLPPGRTPTAAPTAPTVPIGRV